MIAAFLLLAAQASGSSCAYVTSFAGARVIDARDGTFAEAGKVGVWTNLLNHSFMIPGLIGVSVSTLTAYLISRAAF